MANQNYVTSIAAAAADNSLGIIPLLKLSSSDTMQAAGNITVNALVLTNGITLAEGTNTLTVASGGIATAGGAGTIIIQGTSLVSGSPEVDFSVGTGQTLDVDVPVAHLAPSPV